MKDDCLIQKKFDGKERVYELTTNAKDGFSKWLVRGIKDDECAKKIMKKAFGKYSSKTLYSYYDDFPNERKTDYSKVPKIKEFLRRTKDYRK